MKIPVLYGQKGRSFRLANYPWQSMNVKRIIRDRVYRATLFSPRNYPFTLSTREKKEKKKDERTFNVYSIVPPFFPRNNPCSLHFFLEIERDLDANASQLRRDKNGSKFASHDGNYFT